MRQAFDGSFGGAPADTEPRDSSTTRSIRPVPSQTKRAISRHEATSPFRSYLSTSPSLHQHPQPTTVEPHPRHLATPTNSTDAQKTTIRPIAAQRGYTRIIAIPQLASSGTTRGGRRWWTELQGTVYGEWADPLQNNNRHGAKSRDRTDTRDANVSSTKLSVDG